MNSPSPNPVKANILIADDNIENLKLLSQVLSNVGYKVRGISNGQRIFAAVQLLPPDLILLDIMMPNIDGFEVCCQLKSSEKTREIPVIFISAFHQVNEKIKAFEVGGVDYITKPFQIPEVLARVEHQLRLRSLQKKIIDQNQQLQTEIKERQLIEAKLQSSESAIRYFFEAMNDVVLLIDADNWNIQVAPTKTTRFYPVDVDILSLTIEQFYLEDSSNNFKLQVETAIAQQKLINFDYSLKKDNHIFWFTASINPTSQNTVIWVARDIRDRKQIEAALQDSEQRFRSLVKNIPGIVFRCLPDENWTMLFISDAVAEITGFQSKNFLENCQQTWGNLIYAQDRPNVELIIEKALKNKQPFAVEYRITHADGGIRWLATKGQGYFESEDLIYLDGAVFDITERKTQEKAFQLIVEGTAAQTGHNFFYALVHYLAIVLNVRYAIVTEKINDSQQVRSLAFWMGENYGQEIEYDVTNTPCESVLKGKVYYCPQDVQKMFPQDQKLKDLQGCSYLGIPLLNSTGQVLGHICILDTKPLVNNPNHQLILRIFAARAGAEIERKIVEDTLNYRAKIEHCSTTISRAFLDLEFDEAIDLSLHVLGEVTGSDRTYFMSYSQEQNSWQITHQWCQNDISNSLKNGEISSLYSSPWMYENLVNEGLIHLHEFPLELLEQSAITPPVFQSLLNVSLQHRNQLTGCLGLETLQNRKEWNQEEINLLKFTRKIITIAQARYQAEIAQQYATEAALTANKAKSEFLANMSHELRTPLTAILGLSEALKDEVFGPLTAKQHQKLATIEQSGQHLLELINDVLDLSKIEAGKMELQQAATDIGGLCQASLAFVRQQAHQKQIKLISHISSEINQAVLDERRIRQVLINLLSNAVKFTPEGGQVWIEVKGDLEQEILHFTVIDTGIGISQENMKKLFQPFVQLDSSFSRKYSGTGLGLALVRQVVELHGGSVALESKLGQGSRFTVSLPWIIQTKSNVKKSVINSPVTINLNHILIVEDSAPAAEQMSLYLSQMGFSHTTIHPLGTGTIEAALDINPDVIILDLQLPDRSGWDVLAQLKAEPKTQNVPVLIVSVADEPAHLREDYEYLLKPFTAYQFQIALKKLMALTERSKKVQEPENNCAPLILFADDNESNVSTIVDYLEARGYRLITAINGREAVQITTKFKPDLILMDIQMPEMDGLEATRRIRQLPDVMKTPVIALTSLAMPGDAEKCLQAGVNEYLAKPVSLKKLVEVIARYLSNSGQQSALIS